MQRGLGVAPGPSFFPAFSLRHFDLCCLCQFVRPFEVATTRKIKRHICRSLCHFAVASSSEMESIKNKNKNANQFAPLQLRVQHATSVNFGYVSYFCGVGVGCGGVGFLPLTLPLLYDDNKSRKAATTTTTTETQLGPLSVYIIDRPRCLPPPAPHTLPCPTRRSVCLRDFFLTLV